MADKEVAPLSEQRLQEIRERAARWVGCRCDACEAVRDLLAELTRSRAALLGAEIAASHAAEDKRELAELRSLRKLNVVPSGTTEGETLKLPAAPSVEREG